MQVIWKESESESENENERKSVLNNGIFGRNK